MLWLTLGSACLPSRLTDWYICQVIANYDKFFDMVRSYININSVFQGKFFIKMLCHQQICKLRVEKFNSDHLCSGCHYYGFSTVQILILRLK